MKIAFIAGAFVGAVLCYITIWHRDRQRTEALKVKCLENDVAAMKIREAQNAALTQQRQMQDAYRAGCMAGYQQGAQHQLVQQRRWS